MFHQFHATFVLIGRSCFILNCSPQLNGLFFKERPTSSSICWFFWYSSKPISRWPHKSCMQNHWTSHICLSLRIWLHCTLRSALRFPLMKQGICFSFWGRSWNLIFWKSCWNPQQQYTVMWGHPVHEIQQYTVMWGHPVHEIQQYTVMWRHPVHEIFAQNSYLSSPYGAVTCDMGTTVI